MGSKKLRIALVLAILAAISSTTLLLCLGRSTPDARPAMTAVPAATAPSPAARTEAGGSGVERSFGSPRRASFL